MSSKLIRNKIFDIARGVAILCVCAFHLIYTPEGGIAQGLIKESVWFAIAFFFLLSGYLYRIEYHDLLNRTRKLLIISLQYTFGFLVIGGIYCMFFHSYTFKDICIDFVYTYLRPEFAVRIISLDMFYWDRLLYDEISQSWFVWTMLFTLPVFYLLVRYTSRNFRNLFISCAVLLAISVILYDYSSYVSWGLTLVPVYAAVMLAGDYLSGHNIFERIIDSGNYFIVLTALIIHMVMYYFSGSPRAFMNELGTIGRWSVITFFVQAFIGIYAFILICGLLVKIRYVSEFLQLAGRNSLLIMFLHRPFGVLFSDLLGTYIKSGATWQVDDLNAQVIIYSLIVFVLSVISCSVFAVIKDKINNNNN